MASEPVEMAVEPRPRRRVPRLLSLAIALILVGDIVGIATIGGSTTLTRVAISDRVTAAAGRTLAARSAQFTQIVHVDVDFGTRRQSTDVTSDGAVDFVAHAARVTAHEAGFAFETRLVGGVAYLKLPAVALPALHVTKPWVAIALPAGFGGGASSSPLPGAGDPAGTLRGLIATSKGGVTGAQEVGRTSIRGVDTTHYVMTVDPAVLARQAHDAVAALLPGFTPTIQMKSMTLDEWIDAHGLLRRTTTSVDAAVTLAGRSANEKTTSTAEYYDFGIDVNVVAPPAADVTRVSSLTQLLGGAGLPAA